jgi:putative ABC transport system permease protein
MRLPFDPRPMIKADLRQLGWIAWAIVLLVAAAVAVNVALLGLERGIRHGATRAADDFDLLIGAPGSPAQLVLTSIYLEPEALPLIDGRLLTALGTDPRVAGVAPIVLGDVASGYPLVGTTAQFASRWSRIQPAEGRMFQTAAEAVIGADVQLQLGVPVVPSHAPRHAGMPLGRVSEMEAGHRHAGSTLTVIGRMARTGSAWDRAIIVPVEAVWQTHGLGSGHARDDAPLGPPFDAAVLPGITALVVKPKGIADAYALRARYSQAASKGTTMALFPAEVLVALYQRLGQVRDLTLAVSALNGLAALAMLTLLLLVLTGLRRQRYALLRALGAPARYLLAATWGSGAALCAAGAALGLVSGWLLAWALAAGLARQTGLAVVTTPAWGDVAVVGAIAGVASLLALVPAWLAYRQGVADGLRG